MKNNYNKIFVVFSVVFASATLIFMCLFLSYWATSKNYRNQLENNYMKSFYEMVDGIDSLEVDTSKLVATTSLKTQRELLGGMYNTCGVLVNNINLLPINYNNLTEINKFINTAGGYYYSLLLKNYSGNALTNSDYTQINTIHNRIKEIQYDLNSYIGKLESSYSIVDDISFGANLNSNFSAGLINTESSYTDVPALIYDGPFSDSVLNREINGLGNIEYTIDNIESKLHSVFTGFSIYYLGETNGKFQTYNFDVKGDIDLYVSVTKLGGLILNITSFGCGGNKTLDDGDGVVLAQSFASDIGIDNMYMVWRQRVGNIMYVNLAPIINHVIYYPDLIKVKVDLSLGLVVGWEATNYATNHVDRSFSASISFAEAERSISSQLTIIERNFAIIPDKYVGELSTYEFICTWHDYTYYIYIDSNTGEEANIMRVINTSSGNLLE